VAGKRRKRRRRPTFDRFWAPSDPCEGLEVHNVKATTKVSKRYYSFTMFDADNVAISSFDGKRHQAVSIVKKISLVNDSKTDKMSKLKVLVRGRE
jgi:hypothetical protein